jgi:imidazolonepropionase-like amidohydrolase
MKTLIRRGTVWDGTGAAPYLADVLVDGARIARIEREPGRIPGPRLRAAGPETTVTAGLGDENRLHMARESFGIVADGPDAIARAVRLCVREAEVRIACEVAHDFGKRVASHSRASKAIKRAVQCGVDVIYHCEFADSEALDLLEAARERVFVGPAIGLIHNTMHEAEPWGITRERARELGMDRCLENAQKTYRQMRKRGIRAVIGGDYGFAWTPQGTNARDIEHMVTLFDYPPSEALQCATRIGGELMGLELGVVREGCLADLLLVDGNPLDDVRVLQDKAKLRLIMKDGTPWKNTLGEVLH